MKIKKLTAKKIMDSRGKSTVEVRLQTEAGVFFASVPSGTSVGSHEAKTVRPEKAIENIKRVIAPAIEGREFTQGFHDQKKVDQILLELDGAGDKSRLGANAILPVSIALSRALARDADLTLYNYINKIYSVRDTVSSGEVKVPQPCFLIVEAGRHGEGAEIQEFMVAPDEGSFEKNLKTGKEIYKNLGNVLKKEKNRGKFKIGLEGGYTGIYKNCLETLDLMKQAVGGLKGGAKIDFYLDCAATEFFRGGFYEFENKKINGRELGEVYKNLVLKYPIAIIEDPFSEEDWESWQEVMGGSTSQGGRTSKILIVGDDLTASNSKRIKEAKEKNACNGMILKPNQIGTVTEAVEAAGLAKSFGWKIIVSHRSGETIDDFIADFAVGVNADYLKSGAPKPKERMAKYSRLLAIETDLR